MQWLKDEFLKYLEEWEEQAKKLDLSTTEQNKTLLSAPTREGLRITGENELLH